MARPRTRDEDVHTLIAIESGFWTAPDGTEYTFRAGETLVSSDHPLVTQANADWFTPVDKLRARPSIEEATAAPGTLRGDE